MPLCDNCKKIFRGRQRIIEYNPPLERPGGVAGLLGACKQLLRLSPSPKASATRQIHHRMFAEIWKSASNGCFFCCELRASFLPPGQDARLLPQSSELYAFSITLSRLNKTPAMWPQGTLHLDTRLPGDPNSNTCWDFLLPPEYSANYIEGYMSPRSPFQAKRAKRWLQNCLNNHENCCLSHSSMDWELPTRLLHIGKPALDQVALVNTKDLPAPVLNGVQYATLSHVWGKSHTLRLTSSTKELLQKGIRTSKLGRTFRDAITFAQSINIEFIWIDSLCIQQDLAEDWKQEAPRMADVYGGSFLNIAATAGSDTNAGLWKQGHTYANLEPPVVSLKGTPFPNGRYLFRDRHYFEKAFTGDTAPLITRAWVLQELFLATRTLHFFEHEMFWVCGEQTASETFPPGVPPGIPPLGTWDYSIPKPLVMKVMQHLLQAKTSTQHREGNGQQTPVETPNQLLIDIWDATVRIYTKCNLTYKTDKLAAISGIAKLLQKAFGVEYWAGLWKEDILLSLLWVVKDKAGALNSDKTYPASPYRAPTWSWASLDGPILARGEDLDSKHTPVGKILECHIETNDADDVTVGIVGARMRIAGWPITVITRDGAEGDVGLGFFVNGDKTKRTHYSSISLDSNVVPTDRIVAFPLVWEHSLPGNSYLKSLLLYPVEGIRNHYYRIGTWTADFRIFGLTNDNPIGEKLCKFKNAPWLEYESRDAEGRCTIVVV
ncbi:hypothetical protein RB597_002828 [Gaeumannomyces tritici]